MGGFYAPTVISYRTIRERTFKSKYMFMPLHRNERHRAKYRAWIRTRAGRNSQFKIQKMKAFSKITILAAAAAFPLLL